jgi:hypothetical protein
VSRGRPRHQASRRRAYSSRQRELRERRVRALREESFWTGDGTTAFEIDEPLDFDAPGSWTTGTRPRGTAA